MIMSSDHSPSVVVAQGWSAVSDSTFMGMGLTWVMVVLLAVAAMGVAPTMMRRVVVIAPLRLIPFLSLPFFT